MSAVRNPKQSADYHVADMALADWGRKEILIAETEMPGLMATRKSSSALNSDPSSTNRRRALTLS